jgi:hypothetical protein
MNGMNPEQYTGAAVYIRDSLRASSSFSRAEHYLGELIFCGDKDILRGLSSPGR